MKLNIEISDDELKQIVIDEIRSTIRETVTQIVRESETAARIRKTIVDEATPNPLKTKLTDTGLPSEITIKLEEKNIRTLEDILSCSRNFLKGIKGMGNRKMDEIDEFFRINEYKYEQLPPKTFITDDYNRIYAYNTYNQRRLIHEAENSREGEEFIRELRRKGVDIDKWIRYEI